MRSLLVALVLANLIVHGLVAGWLSLPDRLRPERDRRPEWSGGAQINPGLLRVEPLPYASDAPALPDSEPVGESVAESPEEPLEEPSEEPSQASDSPPRAGAGTSSEPSP